MRVEKKGSFLGRTHILSTCTKMHSHWSYLKVNTTNCSEEGEWKCVCLGVCLCARVCTDWNCLERVKWQLKGKRVIEADMVSSTSPLFVALTPCNGAELRAGLNFKCFLHIAALMLRKAEILQQRLYNRSAWKLHYYYYFSQLTGTPGEGQKYINVLIEHWPRTSSLIVYVVRPAHSRLNETAMMSSWWVLLAQ